MYDYNVTQSEFEKVIDFLRSTQVPPEFFRSNLLLMLEKHFDYSVSSLWLVGSHSLYDPISYNVDRRIIRSYQDYYYKFDPFHPIYMKNRRLMEKPVLTMDDIALTDYPSKDMSSNPYFSYLSDEYSLTQDIILSFNVGRQQYGSAALFTKHSNDANRMLFINCLNIITPFIAQMLCQSLQMLDLKFKTETLESVVCSMDYGIIMFDGTGSVLYYNTQLLRFCQDITGRDISADTLREFACSFLPLACGAGDRVELPEFSEGYRAVIVHLQEQGRHVYTVRISPRQTEARSALALPASLSPREREIVSLISQGKTNSEIASLLYISVPTVKTHISNIFQKTGVSNRTSLLNRLRMSSPD